MQFHFNKKIPEFSKWKLLRHNTRTYNSYFLLLFLILVYLRIYNSLFSIFLFVSLRHDLYRRRLICNSVERGRLSNCSTLAYIMCIIYPWIVCTAYVVRTYKFHSYKTTKWTLFAFISLSPKGKLCQHHFNKLRLWSLKLWFFIWSCVPQFLEI